MLKNDGPSLNEWYVSNDKEKHLSSSRSPHASDYEMNFHGHQFANDTVTSH